MKGGLLVTRSVRRSGSAARIAVVAGVLAAGLAPAAAHAARTEKPLPGLTPAKPPKPAPPPSDDALGQDGFYIEANELTENQNTHVVTARGGVEARYQGRVVRADEIDYDQTSGIVKARGHVVIVNADGTVEFSDNATLDRQMSQGVATAFSSHMQENVTVAAATVIRRSPLVTEMRQVIFTPCDLCAKHPSPTWSIRASKVVDNKQNQTIYFRDAVILVKGLPVFYTPLIWTPDPGAKQKSGFLIPTIGISSLRGFSWEQPYLQLISPSSDIVISPQFNQKVNPFLNIDLRKRFWTGAIDVRAGYTYEENFGTHGVKLGDLTSRSYILAKGQFQADANWQWGFTAERASDPLIFDKYGVVDPFIDRGLYAADDRRLISQVDAVRQDQSSYFSIAAIGVQGLRSTDINGTFPAIAPLIEAHYEPDQPILGGRLRIDGSGVVLTRDDAVNDPSLPGINSRRGTVEADWRRTFIFASGLRLDPFVSARGDLYSLSNLQPPFGKDATIARGIATAGLDASWPFVKREGPFTVILEPMAQLALSPVVKQDPRIPNEDSVDFEFDSTNLFQIDKSPGYDILDSGQRLNVGGRVTVVADSGLTASALVGRSFRAQDNPAIPARTGLSGTVSDWIFATDATPLPNTHIFTRWRIDSDTLAINRLEIGTDVTLRRFNGTLRYLEEAQDPTGAQVKDLDFRAELDVLKNWGITAYAAREFTTGVWRERDIGFVYKDDCIRLEVVYHSSNTTNGVLGPSQGIAIRLTLATFGNAPNSLATFGNSPNATLPIPH